MKRETSLYIHIPYCRKKCLYCDFFSGGASIADWVGYMNALLGEFCERASELTASNESASEISAIVSTIYIGGGTPSLIIDGLMGDFLSNIRKSAEFRGIKIAGDAEITIEVNPEDVNQAKIEEWKRAGITRVSIGIQSFNDTLLYNIGRNHDVDAARSAMRLLCENFSNLSADLIFGLPGQTIGMLREDLDEILSYPIQHISVYSLMYEEGTALTALRDSGLIVPVSDEASAEMFSDISEKLAAAGFEQYEISNYCKPGYRSRHNSGYWTSIPYLGLGVSAHSYDGDSIRRFNTRDIKGYIKRFKNSYKPGKSGSSDIPNDSTSTPFYTEEHLSAEERLEERIMLGLRTKEGINLDKIASDFGAAAAKNILRKAEQFLHSEPPLLKINPVNANEPAVKLLDPSTSFSSISLTKEGIMLSDTIIIDLL